MKRCVAIMGLVLVVTLLAPRAWAQEPPPSGSRSRTVHLTNLAPDQATALLAWMADVNAMAGTWNMAWAA